ncbi:hypothetical protein [Dysgonomonas sp. ZJ709]|uniref:hypothetical protein n=1 Tax=Dysgonomonas sp. ZJ709 TaxID=2709797 RepID=UPI0013ED5856|nr:hypothetical protein [Dysgonomonas sp. ZJ709]
MKKTILIFALLISAISFANKAEAQNVSININVNQQPAWGPIGYDYVGYYYFPDIDCYYNVNAGMFHYFDRGYWVSSRYLPYAYSNYDLYGLYKVVLNVRDPWIYNHNHRRSYVRYKGYRNQVVIRDSRDNRYRDSRHNNVVWYSSDKKENHSERPNNNRNNVSRPNTNRPETNRPVYNNTNKRSDKVNIAENKSGNDNNKRREQNKTHSGYNKSDDSSGRNSGRGR